MKAIITVMGKDQVGILAKISTICANYNSNVLEVNQNIVNNLFSMIMIVDINNINSSLKEFKEELENIGKKLGMKIHVMHEDIFNSMHKI